MRKVIVGICIASMLSLFFYKPEKTKAEQVLTFVNGYNLTTSSEIHQEIVLTSGDVNLGNYRDANDEAAQAERIWNNFYYYCCMGIAQLTAKPSFTVINLIDSPLYVTVSLTLKEVGIQPLLPRTDVNSGMLDDSYSGVPINVTASKSVNSGAAAESLAQLSGVTWKMFKSTTKDVAGFALSYTFVRFVMKFDLDISVGTAAGNGADPKYIIQFSIAPPTINSVTDLAVFTGVGNYLLSRPFEPGMPERTMMLRMLDIYNQNLAQTTIQNQSLLKLGTIIDYIGTFHGTVNANQLNNTAAINTNGVLDRQKIDELKTELIEQENSNRIEMRTQGELTREEIKKDLQSQTISLSNKMDEIMNSYNNSGEQEEAGKIDSMVQQQKDAEAETAKAKEAMQNVDYTAIQMEDGQELSVIKNVMQALLTQTNEKLKWGIVAAFTLVLAACAVGLRRFF